MGALHGRDAGQISLIRTIVVLVVVAILLFEGGAIGINHFQVGDVATRAAEEANVVYFNSRNRDAAAARAKEYVEDNGSEFIGLSIDPQRKRLAVTAKKRAKTLLAYRIGRLKRYTVAETTQSVPLRV